MKRFIQLLVISLFFTACTSMPEQIDDKYLVEKNEKESATINNIEQKIITKNKEQQATEKKLKEISPASEITEDEIKLLKKENSLLKDQVDFYTQTKDAVTLESRNKQLQENESAIKMKTALLNFQAAEKKMTEAELDLKAGELNALIAELNYEKSKIAATYREKHNDSGDQDSSNPITRFFVKKDPDDKYGYKKYAEYFKKQQEELFKSEKNFKEAEKSYKDAKEKLPVSNK